MSYKINKTDGTLLVDLVDGRIDTDSTDVTLFGKNYTGYGEFLNENFGTTPQKADSKFSMEHFLDQLTLL